MKNNSVEWLLYMRNLLAILCKVQLQFDSCALLFITIFWSCIRTINFN